MPEGWDRVFELHTGASLILLDVSLTGGALPGATGRGGGIRNNGGTLSIIRTDIRGNGAGSGAGVDNTSGDTLIEDSLIRDNVGVQAAAVSNFAGTTTIRNTTVSANAATNGAVGLIGGSLTIESSTVAVNSAIGLLNVANAPFTVSNTIVANNAFDAQGPFSSGGHNLIGDVGTATGFMDGVNGDQVGGNGSPPVLAALVPLGDYGGPTLTHSLGFGSPAIDAGSCSSLKTDQRGSPRRVDLEDAVNIDDACDIGAVELALAPTLSRLVVPVRWCGVRGAPSIEDPTVVGETSVNDVLRARHENVTNQIFGPQANIELRSAANANIEEYPILDDPDCVEDPPGTFTCEIGQHGDVFVNPDTGNFDEFQNLIADCRAAWQAQDPTIVGVTAVQINRFVDADGNPRGLLGIGGRAQVNNAAEQTVASRVMVVDRFYRIDVPGNPDPPNPLDRSDQLLGHEFGHAASLSHGDGIDNNGDGDLDNDDESAIGDPQLDGSKPDAVPQWPAADRRASRAGQGAFAGHDSGSPRAAAGQHGGQRRAYRSGD